MSEITRKPIILVIRYKGSVPSANQIYSFKVNKTKQSKNKDFVEAYPSKEHTSFMKRFKPIVNRTLSKYHLNSTPWYPKKETEEGIWIVEFELVMKDIREDPSNKIKIVLDALVQANVFNDDRNVRPKITHHSYDSKDPKMRLKIYKSPEIGVFKNADELKLFQSTQCSQCSKDPEKCPKMRKYKKSYREGMLFDMICPHIKTKGGIKDG